jgi:glucosamine 6-phosphate synthetase-like amidotransferase/phosphosugar isomerase protein
VPGVLHYLGYGLTHPIALEGALRLKEITYAHCEGIFSSEFKHGPLSAVHDDHPVLFITAPGDEMMMVNHVNEVTTRSETGTLCSVERPDGSLVLLDTRSVAILPEVTLRGAEKAACAYCDTMHSGAAMVRHLRDPGRCGG